MDWQSDRVCLSDYPVHFPYCFYFSPRGLPLPCRYVCFHVCTCAVVIHIYARMLKVYKLYTLSVLQCQLSLTAAAVWWWQGTM